MIQPRDRFMQVRDKYPKIPDWEWLNRNFKLKFEDEGHLLEHVRSSVSDKLDAITHSIVEPIIAGGENYCCYFERKMLTDVQKNELWEVYTQLQALLWRSNALSVDFSEKAVADWLIDVKGTLDKTKPRLLAICGRLAEGWQKYKRETTETAYHG